MILTTFESQYNGTFSFKLSVLDLFYLLVNLISYYESNNLLYS